MTKKIDIALLVANLPKGRVQNRIGRMPLEEWKLASGPSCWEFADQDKDVTVLLDWGYGNMAVFIEDRFIAIVRDVYVDPDSRFVVLDKDVYGLTKYIWR